MANWLRTTMWMDEFRITVHGNTVLSISSLLLTRYTTWFYSAGLYHQRIHQGWQTNAEGVCMCECVYAHTCECACICECHCAYLSVCVCDGRHNSGLGYVWGRFPFPNHLRWRAESQPSHSSPSPLLRERVSETRVSETMGRLNSIGVHGDRRTFHMSHW